MSDRDIDTVLDACLALIEEQGLSPEDCLDRYPEHRSELEALLPVALRFRAARSLSAPATLQARIDARLAAVRAADKPKALPLPVTFWTALRSIFRVRNRTSERRALMIPTLVTLILVAFVSMTGLVAGADAAGPGDFLFGLDIAIENARLSITSEDEEQAKLRLRFAIERLEELKIEIEGEGNPEDIQAALARLEEALSAIESLLVGLTAEQRAELEAAIALLWTSSQELTEFEFELEIEDGVGELELEIESGDDDDLDDDDLDDDRDDGDLDDDDLDDDDRDDGDLDDDDDDDEDECDSSGPGNGDCPDDDDDDEDECDSSGPGNGDCPDDEDDEQEECDSSGPGGGDDCDDEDDDDDDEDDDDDDDEEDDD